MPRSRRNQQASPARLLEPRRTHIRMLKAAVELAPDDHWVRLSYYDALVTELSLLSEQIATLDSTACTADADLLALKYLQLAISQMDLARNCCAVRSCQRCLELVPNHVDGFLLLGQALRLDGRFQAAETVFRRMLVAAPDDVRAMEEMGLVLTTLCRLDEAEEWLRRAMDADPTRPRTWTGMSRLSMVAGKFDEAGDFLREAEARGQKDAMSAFFRGVQHLAQGEYTQGWTGYERRQAAFKRDFVGFPWDQPRWDGRPLDGKTLLVQAEQGFGDSLQFVRFVSQIQGGRVLLAVPSPLANLLRRCDGVAALVHLDGVPRGSFHVQTSLASLPSQLNVTLETVAPKIPYVFPDSEAIQAWAARLSSAERDSTALRVGLAWSSSAVFIYAQQKSIPADAMLRLVDVPATTCVSLQVRRPNPPLHPALLDFTDEFFDFDETAAMIANLDLVITVDTAVAHLAGAMGKPVWVLLMDDCDWRWLRDRDDSPWYPTMRLFRQRVAGDWDEVLERVAAALAELASGDAGKDSLH